MLKFVSTTDVPHIDPCKKNKLISNNFKFDMKNRVHRDMFEYIKNRLSKDIEIYNKVCLIRSLSDKFLIK